MSQPRTAPRSIVVVATFVIAVATVAPALAQNGPAARPVAVKDTGMFGLTEGRVARIDAVNLGGSTPGGVRLEFFDAAGTMVAEKFMLLAPGESGDLEFMSSVVGQKGRMSLRARASILDGSTEGMATRCGRNIRVSAIVLAPENGQTLRKVRVVHRDMGVCADKGRKPATQVVR